MMLRVLALGLVLVTTLLLQAVITPALSVQGVRPDLLLLTVVGLALHDGAGTGVRYGFAAGFCLDLLSGVESLVGLSTLLLLLVGYAVGLGRPYLVRSGMTGEVVVGAAAGATSVLGLRLLKTLLGFPGAELAAVLSSAVVAAGWSALLAPFVCRGVAAVSRRFRLVSTSTATAGQA